MIPAFKVSKTQLGFADVLGNSYPAGTGIHFIREGHLITDPLPPMVQSRMMWFCKWFPAAGVDIGVPDSGQPGPQVSVGVLELAGRERDCAGGTTAVISRAPLCRTRQARGICRARYWLSRVRHCRWPHILPPSCERQERFLAATSSFRTAQGVVLMKSPIL